MSKRHGTFKIICCAAVILGALFALVLFSGCGRKGPALFKDTLPLVEPDPQVHVRLSAAGDPEIIYAPLADRAGYRYGPSMIYYADGTSDAWFSCNGNQGEWDWVSVRHSADKKTFTSEHVALSPTPDTYDKFSCCDPGAIYFGGYYYVGYTSTIESTGGGVCNNVFVARSKTPEGPYEKWNGSGWGGDPAPIVYYDEYDLKYGAGEPSMVVVDGVLYMYYTWACPEGNYARVSTSDTSENWPANLVYRGEAISKDTDSIDVVYVEDIGKFIAIATQKRFSEYSGIGVMESDDGIHFTKTDFVCEGFYQYCHNAGIARRPDGHVQLKDDLFIGYAFSNGGSENWGKWATAFQPIKLEIYTGDVTLSPEAKGIFCDNYFTDPDAERPIIHVSSSDRIIELYSDNDKHSVTLISYDTALSSHAIDDQKNVKFYGYDTSLIKIKNNMIYSKGKTGATTVKASYKGYYTEFKVFVHDDFSEFRDNFGKTVKEFTPIKEVYEVRLWDRHHQQLRGLVRFSDGTWGEAFNDGEMIDYKKYPVTYEVADPNVALVNDRGLIYPLAAGETDVKVTIAGEKYFTVKIVVIQE